VSRYLVTPEAENDLDIIKAWLVGKGGPRLSRHVLGRIRHGMNVIGATPGIGHARQDLTSDPVKFWQVFSYLIVYEPVPCPIHIPRVPHGAQDVAAILTGRGRR
jgi:toxin ParE1/3/4